jgi:hypothetical protein
MPAAGQLYTATIARSFPVDLGPISSFTLYDDYGYLSPGKISDGFNSHWNSNLPGTTTAGYDRTGAVQANVAGVEMAAGPVDVWAEVISGKNAAMAFDGPNDGDWHHRFNLAAGLYFNGDVINAQ